jgi:hypothetical protein
MKVLRSLLIITSLLVLTTAGAQSVFNVRAFNEDGTIIVVYDLFTAKNDREFYIKLFYSSDNGQTYSEVIGAAGDVNKILKANVNLTATWKPIGVQTGNLLFKVEALPKVVKKDVVDNLEILGAKRIDANRIEIYLLITNQNSEPLDFLVNQFMITDENGKDYRKVLSVSKNWGSTGINPGIAAQFKVTVIEVPKNTSSIKALHLLCGPKGYSFKDILVKIE